MKNILLLLIFLSCGVIPAAEWNFKDGGKSGIVREKNDPELNGRLNNEKLCNWAREDDRGWFLTLQDGGAVDIPHSDKLNFSPGFSSEITFSCDLSKIGKNNFSNLFTKGYSFNEGYCVMIGRNGTLLLNLKGLKPEYRIIKLRLGSNIEYRLNIHVGNKKVRIFLNGHEVAAYDVTGKLDMRKNRKPLHIGGLSGYGFTGNIYNFKITSYSPPVSTPVKKKAVRKSICVPDPPGTVVINDFPRFTPASLIRTINSYGPSDERIWHCRTRAFMRQSKYMLHPPASPDSVISFDPKLKGNYDLYIGVRAVNSTLAIQINVSGSDKWYKIETGDVGMKHRNLEVLCGKNINMDDRQIRIASCGRRAYLGYIKLVPSDVHREELPMDPVSTVAVGEKITSKNLEEEIGAKIKSGYFKQLSYVENRSEPKPSPKSVERGFIMFEQPWMQLLFPNSVPTSDPGKLKLTVNAAPGEDEPVTIGIRALRDLGEVTLCQSKMFAGGITVKTTVVESIPKRSSNFWKASEFIIAPQYLEKSPRISIKAGISRQFWLTCHIPEGTAPGCYTGEFELKYGKYSEKIPLKINVYPIKLRSVRGYDIGFWVNFGTKSTKEAAQLVRELIDYNITSFVLCGNVIKINDDQIDMDGSLLTAIAEAGKKYGLKGSLIIETEPLSKDLKRLVRQLDETAAKRKWPKRLYTTHDEVPSHPELFPAFIRNLKALKAAGVTVCADHIWYHTTRPLQAEINQAVPYIDVFICRFNTRNLFYRDSWRKMETEALRRGKKLYSYNFNNSLTFAQTGSMRFATGWFFRSFGKNTNGQLYYSYNSMRISPYTDLDGIGNDTMFMYPASGKRQGGPAIELEAFREGVDDLRYILTLEAEIAVAHQTGFTKQAATAEKVLKGLENSFDQKEFYKKSVFSDSKWEYRKTDRNGNITVSGELNIPNGWRLSDYDRARKKLAAEIIRLQKLNQAPGR